MRSSGLSRTGVVLPPNTAAPPGVSQISSVSPGNLMFNEPFPHTSSKRGRYTACESLNAMQAVSGLPISWVSTGGCCACSASAFLSRYPVARESQKLPPKKAPSTWLYCSTGKNGAYVYLCAVRLPARKCSVPGYAIIVRFTDGIGPLKATYGMWQDAHAIFLLGEMFLSYCISSPSVSTASVPVFIRIGG